MLRKGISIFFLIFLISCESSFEEQDNDFLYYSKSRSVIGQKEYQQVLSNLKDSLKHWSNNGIGPMNLDSSKALIYLDTLLCFNKSKNKFVSTLLTSSRSKNNPSGIISLICGEKINGLWYFFQLNDNLIIPKSLKKENFNEYFNYSELHELALTNFYNGYLNNGQINESWFIHHFEGIGWGDFNNQTAENDWYLKGRRFKTRKEFFEAAHLDKVKVNWASRDTTKPIIPLPAKNLP